MDTMRYLLAMVAGAMLFNPLWRFYLAWYSPRYGEGNERIERFAYLFIYQSVQYGERLQRAQLLSFMGTFLDMPANTEEYRDFCYDVERVIHRLIDQNYLIFRYTDDKADNGSLTVNYQNRHPEYWSEIEEWERNVYRGKKFIGHDHFATTRGYVETNNDLREFFEVIEPLPMNLKKAIFDKLMEEKV